MPAPSVSPDRLRAFIAPSLTESMRRAWKVAQSLVWTLLVVGSAWLANHWLAIDAGSDAGYWIGVAGGSAMLALFAYPLRKRLPALRGLGSTRRWFIFHMVMGALGPWLILLHCGFRIGSTNAAVALGSMLIVAGSGVIGRFLYVHVHRGLDGRRAELAEWRAQLEATHERLASSLALAPRVRQALFAFEQAALAPPVRRNSLALVWATNRAARHARDQTRRLIDEALAAAPATLDGERRRRIRAHWRRQAAAHIAQATGVAQLRAWERLFALWHVLHLPFVYVMVACAVVHVVAVHAY